MTLEEMLQKYREKGREYGSYDPKKMAEYYLTEKALDYMLPKVSPISAPNAPNVATPASSSTSTPSSIPMLSNTKNLYDFATSSPQASYSPPPVQVAEAAPMAAQGAASAAEIGAGAGAASSGAASGAAGGTAAGGAQSGLAAIISKF